MRRQNRVSSAPPPPNAVLCQEFASQFPFPDGDSPVVWSKGDRKHLFCWEPSLAERGPLLVPFPPPWKCSTDEQELRAALQ